MCMSITQIEQEGGADLQEMPEDVHVIRADLSTPAFAQKVVLYVMSILMCLHAFNC